MNQPENLEKVINIFQKNYKLIPLEIFEKDPYKSLVSTIMSSRTNDDTTLKAAARLFNKAPDFESLGKLTREEIEKLIYPVGFYKNKAKHLSFLPSLIKQKHNGHVPQTQEELMLLPGVGLKTANLVLSRTFGKPTIAVDTHVHRISNLLGWVKTKNPTETEKELTKIIPEKYRQDLNRLFVSIGRQHTTKKGLDDFLKKNGLI